MHHTPPIVRRGAVLLCIFGILVGIGCAKKTAERPRTLQSRVADVEQTHHEQAQRLSALEDRVGVLQNHTYEVTTASGQKTRYAVRIVEPVPTPVTAPIAPATSVQQPAHSQGPSSKMIDPAATPAPLTGSTRPQTAPQTTHRTAPAQSNPQSAAQSSSQTGTSLMLPPEAAPAPRNSMPVATNPVGALALPPESLPPSTPAGPTSPITVPAVAPNSASATAPVIADAKLPPSAKGEEAAYTMALNLVRAGQYVQGRAKFEKFLQSYPAGRYAANAYYWMGESFYAQHQYAEALAQFNQAAARFPKHHKTADALLKAGLSAQKMGDTEGSVRYFRTLLTDFPQSEAAQTVRGKGWVR